MNYPKDTRKTKRYNAVFKVEYDSYKDFIIDYTKNISTGGTFIITKENFHIGDTFKILISFPKIIKPIPIDVEVMWIYRENFDSEVKKGIGVKFIYNDEYHKKKFQKLINIISKKYEDEKENVVIKSLFYHSNKFITTSFIDIIKHVNQLDDYKNINFIIRTSKHPREIITDFLLEDFNLIILDNSAHQVNDIITNLKKHKDDLIYIGIGNQDNEMFDFNLKKLLTVSKIEALLKIIVKAKKLKSQY